MQIFLNIERLGLHEIMFSIREGGFEMDKFVLTKDLKFVPDGVALENTLLKGKLQELFPEVKEDLVENPNHKAQDTISPFKR